MILYNSSLDGVSALRIRLEKKYEQNIIKINFFINFPF